MRKKQTAKEKRDLLPDHLKCPRCGERTVFGRCGTMYRASCPNHDWQGNNHYTKTAAMQECHDIDQLLIVLKSLIEDHEQQLGKITEPLVDAKMAFSVIGSRWERPTKQGKGLKR